MKQLLEFLTQKIVTHPKDISIEEQVPGEGFLNLALKVHPEDTGLVIGKQGKTIKALKNIVKVLGIKENKRVNIELTNEQKD
ncbi:MAG: KH domain-containing protein [bacterium]